MMITQENISYIDSIDKNIMPFVQYGDYPDRYPALSALSFNKYFYLELREASRELFAIFEKVVKIFQQAPKNFQAQMDIPFKLLPFLNIPNALKLSTWLSRFDFVVDKNGDFKVIEINSDTPCAIIEAYYANQIAADSFGYTNPNFGEEHNLTSFLYQLKQKISPLKINLRDGNFNATRPFIFSCFEDYPEDFGTTKYLMDLMKINSPAAEVDFVSFYDLQVDENGILLPDGRHAGAIYRLHPMEILIEETATDGTDLGVMFLEKYAEGKFEMFNPPEAIIMQNKSFLALVWQIYLSGKFFNSHEEKIIEQYMLPSFFEEDLNLIDGGEFIKKPIWGREGRNISIIDGATKNVIYEHQIENPDAVICRDSNKFMYQKFVDTPQFEAIADSGYLKGFITLSCFMLGDKPSAVYCRFSPEKVIGTEAYFVPLLEEK